MSGILEKHRDVFSAIGHSIEVDNKEAEEKQKIEREREREKKSEMIINCFMEKVFKELTTSNNNPKWDLGEFISQHLTSDVLLRNNSIDFLTKFYNNLKEKDKEAHFLLEEKNAFYRMTQNERAPHIRYFENDWKEDCNKYIDGCDNLTYPSVGSSQIDVLTSSAIWRIRAKYMSNTGWIFNYDGMMRHIKDAIGCWIFTIELLFPKMASSALGGRRKRKTKKGKTKKGKTKKRRTKKETVYNKKQ
jgi:hypothetical protein